MKSQLILKAAMVAVMAGAGSASMAQMFPPGFMPPPVFLPPPPVFLPPPPVFVPPPPVWNAPLPRLPRFEPPFPGSPPPNPMRAPIYNALGMNHEAQVAAECVAQSKDPRAAAACTALRLTADELNKCFSDGIGGRGCFGENNTLVRYFSNNLDAARRESTAAGAVIRGTTGISIDDINKHGWKGGPNSEVRKLCNLFGC